MKKVNWMMTTLMALALTVAVFGVSGCKSSCCAPQSKSEASSSKHAMQYYCPMHPEVVQSTTGKCPKCGMDLVEKP
jgi:hypothetical protein